MDHQRPFDRTMNGRDRRSDETSSITRDYLRDLVDQGENASSGLQIQRTESMSTEWTDEKHSLYLNSIEALFVKQLHNREYRSVDMHSRLFRRQKPLDPNSSKLGTNSYFSSGQFKVMKSGCWQKINFERPRTRLDVKHDCRVLMTNPWVNHFRSHPSGKGIELSSPHPRDDGVVCSETNHFERQKCRTSTRGLAASSKQQPTCYAQISHQNSAGSNEEVSDQNFVEEVHEGKQPISEGGKKRTRTSVTDGLTKDQVVPFGKFPIKENPDQNVASSGAKDGAHSGRSSSIPCPEFEAPSFDDHQRNSRD